MEPTDIGTMEGDRRIACAKQIELLARKYTDTADRFALDDCLPELAHWYKLNYPEESYLKVARYELKSYDRRKRPRPNQLDLFPHDRWIPIDSVKKMRIRLGDARFADVLAWAAVAASAKAKHDEAYAKLSAAIAKWLEAWSKEEHRNIVKLADLQRQAFGWNRPATDDDVVVDDDDDGPHDYA